MYGSALAPLRRCPECFSAANCAASSSVRAAGRTGLCWWSTKSVSRRERRGCQTSLLPGRQFELDMALGVQLLAQGTVHGTERHPLALVLQRRVVQAVVLHL